MKRGWSRMRKDAEKEGWLKPQGVYGYWPCQTAEDTLLVYDPDTIQSDSPVVLQQFEFPRQKDGEGICLADYFATVNSGCMDVVAFQVVTVGPGATARFAEMEAAGEYSEAYFLHGLAVQMGGSDRELPPCAHPAGIEPAIGPRKTLFLGLPGHPGPGRPSESV